MRQDLKPSELIEILKDKIAGFNHTPKQVEIGRIIQSSDGIAQAWGLDQIMNGELVEIDTDGPTVVTGMAMNLEEDAVGIILFSDAHLVKEGRLVRRTGRVAQVPSGDALLGRVVDALGRPLDNKGDIPSENMRLVEVKGPGILDRFNVREPLQTGIKAIDAMIPIGRGQRELIIGDRRTGKTTIALDTIINQKNAPPEERVRCFYVAIGQKRSSIVQLVETLRRHGVMEYTTVIAATASDPASMQYLAPYAATSMAEYYRDTGRHALIIYDDLTKHAQAYRELSLLMRRSPGREAYPGDIFYLHSRLLERSARLSEAKGGGSLTSLPIVETQDGDVSAYIPTNVISITDGQIFLETNLFNSGLRPAINVGISVSRVGGDAQTKGMKKVAGSLRMDLAQFRELAAFMQFSSDLDPATKKQLDRGERLTEILKQPPFSPIDVGKQVIILRAGTSGRLDKYATSILLRYQDTLFTWLDTNAQPLLQALRAGAPLDDSLMSSMDEALDRFDNTFVVPQNGSEYDAGYTLNLAMAIGQKAGSASFNRDVLNMIHQITERELASPSLDTELEEIITGKDDYENDRLDALLGSCRILELEKKKTMEDAFKAVSKVLAETDKSLKAKDLAQMFLSREKASPTALTPFFALPHVVLEGHNRFQLVLMRSKYGVHFSDQFPSVHALFFLTGTMDHRHLHLVVISALAKIVRSPAFEQDWLNAEKPEDLRLLVKSIRAQLKK